MLAEGTGSQLHVCLEEEKGEREGTVTDKALRSETSNTKSLLLPEYLILNSCDIHFTHIKIKGHWACGTLPYAWLLVTRMEFSLVSLPILFPQPQNRDTWCIFVE